MERLAQFVQRASYGDLSTAAREALKIRVLDSLGCAIGALGADLMSVVRRQVVEFGGSPLCSLIGGGRTAPDRAAFMNGALVRHLDFMDAYLARGETCHPSDNLAPVLAAAEYADADGAGLMTALAVAYQVQARLSDEAPVRDRGFDHTTQGAFAVGAGVAKALGLDAEQMAHAIALAAVGNVALRVTRTGDLSHWKGLAFPNTAFMGVHAAFLAMRGVTGPLEVFEGVKGFKESVSGPFSIDWAAEDLERVCRTIVKKYDAEVHAQSAVHAALALRARHGFTAADVARVEVEIFEVAYHIIGGGAEGDKTLVATKEQADHSLPYMVAAALCDGVLMPAQYAPERIARDDVQDLLRRVTVRPDQAFSARFPDEMPCRVAIWLKDGARVAMEARDYPGFHTRAASWEHAVEKFNALASPLISSNSCEAIVKAVAGLEELAVHDLTAAVARPMERAH
ncbi:MAG TPA: MmgE/PrpD family protein [Phenylobacterium sp.]|uniref:MmgE/PrpD family protein n=1 Tax=Phenylobacterium sp. TaxID=1871053 RepID=UPI002B47BDEF|nr:MmgE/PrpD family protein [Phenylobacterium sp.]HKR89772.1 MmgE/PrpD family protein [Phenylobacterium sp.]